MSPSNDNANRVGIVRFFPKGLGSTPIDIPDTDAAVEFVFADGRRAAFQMIEDATGSRIVIRPSAPIWISAPRGGFIIEPEQEQKQ